MTEDGIITNSYRMAKFIPLENDTILSVRFLATAVNSITDDDVRLTKRAYIPQNRLRGFESGKIGPTDSGDYIGGNYLSTLNISTTLPNILEDLDNLMEQDESLNEDKLRFVVDLLTAANFSEKEFLLDKAVS